MGHLEERFAPKPTCVQWDSSVSWPESCVSAIRLVLEDFFAPSDHATCKTIFIEEHIHE
jgi:hypothetical protein